MISIWTAHLDRRLPPPLSSSMHQIFYLDELVRNIANCAEHTIPQAVSLLSLACCCKSLEGPVIDVLWRRWQTDLFTILKTLPADSWSVANGVFVRRKPAFPFGSRTLPNFQSLSRNPSQEEWERFRRYTARVTVLGVPKLDFRLIMRPVDNCLACISKETVQIFWTESQRGGFWPGVRSLECYVADWNTTPLISSFLTPTITRLNLFFPHKSNPLLPPTLSLISDTCHRLQSLIIDHRASSSPPGSDIGRLISALGSTLRSIKVRSFTPPEIFPVIFKLPLLRNLELEEPRLPDQIPPGTLPPLETVEFAGDHGPNLAEFLRRFSVKKFARVAVDSNVAIQPLPLLSSLTGATTTMKYITLSPVTTLCRSSIALLCTFTNMTYLVVRCVCTKPKIHSQCSLRLTDQDLLDLGEALPRIRSLGLSPWCFIQRHFAFKTVVHLSRICGSLEYLAAKVDFTSFVRGYDQMNSSSVSPGDHNSQRRRSRLRRWDVGNSPLPSYQRSELVVAVAVATTFPSIKIICTGCEDEEKRKWVQMQRTMYTCQKISGILQAEGERLNAFGDSCTDAFDLDVTAIP